MEIENSSHISFFKPTTDRARYNRNMVVWLVSIWAIAIFGFHFLLKAIEKPIPEPELIVFNSVWNNVRAGTASNNELLQFSHAALHVAGKVFIQKDHRVALDNGISWAVFQLADSAQKEAMTTTLNNFETLKSAGTSIMDTEYLATKRELGAISQVVLKLNPNNVLSEILPLELNLSGINVFTDSNKAIVEKCMPFYTVHNRSFLTDFIFLGFPFHYFYTAVFLLILFIALCWIYCYKVDAYDRKRGLLID